MATATATTSKSYYFQSSDLQKWLQNVTATNRYPVVMMCVEHSLISWRLFVITIDKLCHKHTTHTQDDSFKQFE